MPKKHPTLSDLLTNANADFVRLNPHLAPAGGAGVFRPPSGRAPATPKAHKESTRLEKCNKTETLFYHYLQDWLFDGQVIDIIVQPAKFFELKGGGTYTPDFMVFVHGDLERVHVFEVKGGYRGPGWEQGYERYKRAALEWDGCIFKFTLAEFDRKTQRWTLRGWK